MATTTTFGGAGAGRNGAMAIAISYRKPSTSSTRPSVTTASMAAATSAAKITISRYRRRRSNPGLRPLLEPENQQAFRIRRRYRNRHFDRFAPSIEMNADEIGTSRRQGTI